MSAVTPGARNIVDLMTGLFARFFPQPSFKPWVLCAAAIFGLTYGLSPEDQEFIGECMGLPIDQLPTQQAQRVSLIVARRGGKSKFASFLAVYLACFVDWSPYLSPGERGIGMLVAPDRRQTRTCFRYIEAYIDGVPMLAAMVESRTKEALHLRNGVSIEVHTASFRAVRGFTVLFCIIDEAAFLPQDDSATPDTELIAAVTPAMSTIPGAMLILISSPYARRGELYRAFKDCYGRPGASTFCWKAPTRTMNPTVSAELVARALTEDPSRAEAEYLGEFRRDIESYVSRDVVEACVVSGRYELPPSMKVRHTAFVDVASGTSAAADDFAGAIGHVEGNRFVVDLIFVKRPPFSPEAVIREFAEVLKRYGVSRVTGDRFAGEFPREQFRKYGIAYRTSDLSKSDLFRDFLPLLNSSRVELLDDPKLVAQLVGLERRVSRAGRDSIENAPGAHDDAANAVSGAAVHALLVSSPVLATITVGDVERARAATRAMQEAAQFGVLAYQISQKGSR
jgi:hypothetical protein